MYFTLRSQEKDVSGMVAIQKLLYPALWSASPFRNKWNADLIVYDDSGRYLDMLY